MYLSKIRTTAQGMPLNLYPVTGEQARRVSVGCLAEGQGQGAMDVVQERERSMVRDVVEAMGFHTHFWRKEKLPHQSGWVPPVRVACL